MIEASDDSVYDPGQTSSKVDIKAHNYNDDCQDKRKNDRVKKSLSFLVRLIWVRSTFPARSSILPPNSSTCQAPSSTPQAQSSISEAQS